jgi:pyrroloquinoline quinone biosynthesis protein D
VADPLGPDDVVGLAPHVRLRFDEARQAWLLLGPERVFTPSETAVAILQACDGSSSVRDIANRLAERYSAPADLIMNDALTLLTSLAGKGYLRLSGGRR